MPGSGRRRRRNSRRSSAAMHRHRPQSRRRRSNETPAGRLDRAAGAVEPVGSIAAPYRSPLYRQRRGPGPFSGRMPYGPNGTTGVAETSCGHNF